MRQLDSDELLQKFNSDSIDIRYSDVDDLTIKTTQFFNFLNEQEISKRILERIEEDFQNIKEILSVDQYKRNGRFYADTLNLLTTREIQGAFGYLNIKNDLEKNPKHRTHYLDQIRNWYRAMDYNDHKQKFNTYFFEPFVELFEWYMKESKIRKDIDYFSEETQETIFERLNELEEKILTKMGYGQEIIFNEVHDVKKLTKKLSQKNWNEVIKGKFIDLALDNIISIEAAKKIIEFLTGEKIKL